MENCIINPIRAGFNPDPSILRVGCDYYIANSTFEWYPGVQIHHSTNLKDWELLTRPLSRASQLDMRGNPDSCGVWAPCLSYADGRFWLVYSDVKRFGSNLLDVKNYIVTAEDITGPWSEPIYINASGFDPSLFHDTDGKKYFVNMVWDHRAGRNPFSGIALQEFDGASCRLVGESKIIFAGTELGVTEAPHLYKRGSWYYLLTAEGGTSRQHAMTLARSESIDGEYELHPNSYVVTTKDAPENYLQRCGHGDIVETEDGQVFVVFLCGRPNTSNDRCVLGRETAIARANWSEDGWLYLENGSVVPETMVVGIDAVNSIVADSSEQYYDFSDSELPLDFQWLRTPEAEHIFSLKERAGYLRLFGRESIGGWFEQALVARRQVDFSYIASTCIEYQPVSFQQYAGLVCYYNRTQFHYLTVTFDAELGRVLQVMSCLGDYQGEKIAYSEPVVLAAAGAVYLRADVEGDILRFSYADVKDEWVALQDTFDMTILSDEGGRGEHGCFTGAFVGMACSDITGSGMYADFEYFEYAGK